MIFYNSLFLKKKLITTSLTVGLIFSAFFILSISARAATIWHASPTGSASGNGSFNAPWDLQTALCGGVSPYSACTNQVSKVVQPGDTIYLRGGIYKYTSSIHPNTYNPENALFTIRVSGNSSNPITIKSYPGEWAVVDGTIPQFTTYKKTVILKIPTNINYVTLMDFEITNSYAVTSGPGSRVLTNPMPISTGVPGLSSAYCEQNQSNRCDRRGSAIDAYGVGTKLVNLVIHDTGQGIGLWDQAVGGEAYGNILFNNGWNAQDRSHGHGIYAQNGGIGGTKTFKDNIVFGNFSNGLNAAGSNNSFTKNYYFEGHVHFNDSFLFFGSAVENITIKNSYFYGRDPVSIGESDSGNKNILIDSNIMYAKLINNSGGTALQLKGVEDATVRNNKIRTEDNVVGLNISKTNPSNANFKFSNNSYFKTVNVSDWPFVSGPGTGYFFAGWQTLPQALDANSTFSTSVPTGSDTASGADVIVRKNEYDGNRANITVFNWKNADSVSAILPVGWSSSDTCELRSAQNYFNDKVSGFCGSIVGSINMQAGAHTVAVPVGTSQTVSTTFPEFGSFVLIKIIGTVATPTPTPNPTPTQQPSPFSTLLFTTNLFVGSRNSQVQSLQFILIQKNYLAVGNTTGYFGSLTKAAVKLYQCAKQIVCSGTESTTGFGSVGPKTRSFLNRDSQEMVH